MIVLAEIALTALVLGLAATLVFVFSWYIPLGGEEPRDGSPAMFWMEFLSFVMFASFAVVVMFGVGYGVFQIWCMG